MSCSSHCVRRLCQRIARERPLVSNFASIVIFRVIGLLDEKTGSRFRDHWQQERAVVRGRPDWNPATLTAKTMEVVPKALALSFSTMFALENTIGLYEGRAARFETVHLLARSEDIGSELGDITDRPSQQRRYDRFGNARCPVLADMTIASDASWCASGPRLT